MYFGGISPTLPGSMEPPQAQVTAASSFLSVLHLMLPVQQSHV